MVDLSKVPVLYTPTPGQQSQATILGNYQCPLSSVLT